MVQCKIVTFGLSRRIYIFPNTNVVPRLPVGYSYNATGYRMLFAVVICSSIICCLVLFELKVVAAGNFNNFFEKKINLEIVAYYVVMLRESICSSLSMFLFIEGH